MEWLPTAPDVILTAHRAECFARAADGDPRFVAQWWIPYWGGVVLPQPLALVVGPLAAVTLVWILTAIATCAIAAGARANRRATITLACMATPFLASWPVDVGLVSWVAGAPLALLALRRLAMPRGRRPHRALAMNVALVALASMCHALWAPVLIAVGVAVARRRREVVALVPALVVLVGAALATRADGVHRETSDAVVALDVLDAYQIVPEQLEVVALLLVVLVCGWRGALRLRARGWRRQRMFLASIALIVVGAALPSLVWTVAIGDRLVVFGLVLLVAATPFPAHAAVGVGAAHARARSARRLRMVFVLVGVTVACITAASLGAQRARGLQQQRFAGFREAIAVLPRGAIVTGDGATDRAPLLAALLVDVDAFDFSMVGDTGEPPLNLPVRYAGPFERTADRNTPSWLRWPTHALLRDGARPPADCGTSTVLHVADGWRVVSCAR